MIFCSFQFNLRQGRRLTAKSFSGAVQLEKAKSISAKIWANLPSCLGWPQWTPTDIGRPQAGMRKERSAANFTVSLIFMERGLDRLELEFRCIGECADSLRRCVGDLKTQISTRKAPGAMSGRSLIAQLWVYGVWSFWRASATKPQDGCLMLKQPL